MPRLCLLPIFLVLLGLSTCAENGPQGFRLSVYLRNANPGVCFLYRLPLDGDPVLVDSFQTTRLDEDFILEDNGPLGEYIYQLFLRAANTSLYFVSDTTHVHARINAVDPQAYTVSGSKGSHALQVLQHARKPIVDSLYILNNKIQNGGEGKEALIRQSILLGERLNEVLLRFSDTVGSPLAALFVAQQVDFKGDTGQHQAFAKRMEYRFSDFAPVQGYVQKLRDYFSLLEVEFEIGDTLPVAVFRDIQGREVTPTSLRGSYCLLEFWASYCPQCLESLEQKRTLYDTYRTKGFELFAFSLDEDRALFESRMARAPFPWPVIADFKGWSGKAAQTYKIDSIPFNILLGPEGRILKKNISPAELGRIISHLQ